MSHAKLLSEAFKDLNRYQIRDVYSNALQKERVSNINNKNNYLEIIKKGIEDYGLKEFLEIHRDIEESNMKKMWTGHYDMLNLITYSELVCLCKEAI